MPSSLCHKIVLILLALLLATPCGAQVEFFERIAKDFKNVNGYVVAVSGEEVIIDLDASHGVAAGDVFCVLKPGRSLVHPVTGNVIGVLEETKGFLKVTQTKTGYSFTRRILQPTGAALSPGDPIRRYENLEAVFWDYAGNARLLGSRLETTLPWLKWESYDAAQRSKPEPAATPSALRAALFFVVSPGRLEVRGPDFGLLHHYRMTESGLEAAASGPAAVEAAPMESSAGGSPGEQKGGQAVAYDAPDVIGTLPAATVMSDFLASDGRLLLAATDGSKIRVFRIAGSPEPLAVAEIPYRGQVLALKWWQPSPGGLLYLAVSCWADHRLASLIYRLESSNLNLVKERIPRILGAFDLDGNGSPETLLGQACDRDVFYGNDIRRVALSDGKMVLTAPSLEFPRRFPVLGSQIGDLTGDGHPEIIFIQSGILEVYSRNDRLYASPKKMGGSISVLTYDIDPTAKDLMTRSVFIEVSPVIRDVDGDGRPEILAVSSDRSWIGAPGISAGIDESRIVVLKYDDMRFQLGKLGNPTGGPVQGLTALNNAVLLVTTEPVGLLHRNGGSRLLSIPLARN